MDDQSQNIKTTNNTKPIIYRGIITSIIVGSVLVYMNYYDKLLNGDFNIYWLTNYLVPFLVSITSGFMANKAKKKKQLELEKTNNDLSVYSNNLKNQLDLNIKKFNELKELQEHKVFMSDIESGFNELVWRYKNHKGFSKKLLNFICKKFRLHQGSLFITKGRAHTENVKISIEPVAHYAYKNVNKTSYEPGEGLIGQCYIEKKVIAIHNIPENYLTIASGLGETLPKSLLILPLIFNEVVIGVLELASLEKIGDERIQDIKRLATLCAATFYALNEEQIIKELSLFSTT